MMKVTTVWWCLVLMAPLCGSGAREAVVKDSLIFLMYGDEVFNVSDFGNHRVQVFGLNGSFLRQLGGERDGAGQFKWPHGIAASKGKVFVSSNHQVQELDISQRWVLGVTNIQLALN